MKPAEYEDWYHTARGAWIGDTEFHLLMQVLMPAQGATLLDVGCGTGYFSRRFASVGLKVSGIDPSESMLAYDSSLDSNIRYLQGSALALPFADDSVDYCTAVTSLCFVDDPAQAIHEMLRVSRHGCVIGLLNRHSRLYQQKYDRGGYKGARWDTIDDVSNWLVDYTGDVKVNYATAVFFPGASLPTRITEVFLPHRLRWGSFLVVSLHSGH